MALQYSLIYYFISVQCVSSFIFSHQFMRFYKYIYKPNIALHVQTNKEFQLTFDRVFTQSLLKLDLPPLVDNVSVNEYIGPNSELAHMEAGCAIEDLGIEVFVGKSTQKNAGRGLFVSLGENVAEVCLPRGTPICGYSRGRFTPIGEGDKTVAYAFTSTSIGVIYKTKLVSLMKLISLISNSTDLSGVIEGHHLYYDAEAEEIGIEPSAEYANRYFIPDVTEDWQISRYGMFANDLGYESKINSYQDYMENSERNNILQIVWKVELNTAGVFYPTWPVVIINRDVKFTNKHPMEVGIQYSWRYWLAARNSMAKDN